MNAAAVMEHRYRHDDAPAMGAPVALSFLFHIGVIIAITFMVPFVVREPIDMEQPMTVDIATLADLNQTDTPAPMQDAKEKPPEEEQPPPAPKPVYNNQESAPDLLTPQPPDIAEEIPEPPEEKIEPEKIEAPKPPPPKPKTKPNRPKPKPPVPDKPKEETKKPEKDINSLLKSLTPDEPEETPPTPEQPINSKSTPRPSQIADFAKELTRTEQDDLNNGVSPCWNVNAGGKYAEDLIVSLQVSINPDMSVRDVRILDQARYSTDSHFRAAADAARRALQNPRCSKLRLPPEKYDHWKTFIYHFDPSHML